MRNLIIAGILLLFVAVPLAVMKFGDNTKEEYVQMAHLAQGLSLASSLKPPVANYYSMMGKFPVDNAAINAPPPEAFAQGSVKSVTVNQGAITVQYTALSGVEDGLLRLVPSSRNNGYFMTWTCETPSFANITKFVPQCQYVN